MCRLRGTALNSYKHMGVQEALASLLAADVFASRCLCEVLTL
jgi:hypothetical protein